MEVMNYSLGIQDIYLPTIHLNFLHWVQSYSEVQLSKTIKLIPPELINGFGKPFNLNRLGDKAYKVSEIMLSKNLEDYYDKLITYWPNATLTHTDKKFNYKFSNELGGIENMMLADQLNYLPNDILVKGDRAAMSQSLETRAPLLDHVLSDFPGLYLLIGGKLVVMGKKKFCVKYYTMHIPKKLIDRPKQGFGLPVNEWIRGPLKDWTLHLFDKTNLPDDGLINGNLARKTLDEHLKNKRNWTTNYGLF